MKPVSMFRVFKATALTLCFCVSRFNIRRSNYFCIFIGRILVICSLWSGFAVAEVPPAVFDLIPTIKAWGTTPELVRAVKAQNAQGLSLDEIKRRDEEWRRNRHITPFMMRLMENEAARKLLDLEHSQPYFLEVFLMDNQGANVAMTIKTSDYWQGDEDKFIESFSNGRGAVYIGQVGFDGSAHAFLVQVSVPVMEHGKAIGALTVGINLIELNAVQ